MTPRPKAVKRIVGPSAKESLIIILILVLLNVIVGFVIYKTLSVKTSGSTIAKINEKSTINGVSVEVSDIKKETNFVMNITPPEGKEIISLDLQIENNSTKTYTIFPSINTFIRDNQGRTYQLTLAAISDPFATNSVEPGQKASGRLAYMVTSQNIPLLLYIENSTSSMPPFVIKLR